MRQEIRVEPSSSWHTQAEAPLTTEVRRKPICSWLSLATPLLPITFFTWLPLGGSGRFRGWNDLVKLLVLAGSMAVVVLGLGLASTFRGGQPTIGLLTVVIHMLSLLIVRVAIDIR